jgi:hypothetical protein
MIPKCPDGVKVEKLQNIFHQFQDVINEKKE